MNVDDVVVAADAVHGGGDAVPAIERAVALTTAMTLILANLFLLIEEGGLLLCVTCSWDEDLIDTQTLNYWCPVYGRCMDKLLLLLESMSF
jgi:hypothetical protein